MGGEPGKAERAKALRAKSLSLEAERQALMDACTADERAFVSALFDLPPNNDADVSAVRRTVDELRAQWKNAGRRKSLELACRGFLAVFAVMAALPLLLLALKHFEPSPLAATAAAGAVLLAVMLVLTLTTDFPALWRNVSLVLESGSFYFFAGLALLIFAQRGSDAREHPSITFILAMLGVAILLFGTGSQATGALATYGAKLPPLPPLKNEPGLPAETDEKGDADAAPEAARPVPWGPLKANAIIAGGAAVLTIIFGFGVIHYRGEIPKVFNDYGQYERVLVKPCYTTARSCIERDFTLAEKEGAFDFRSYDVTASNAEGEELFVRKNSVGFQILALPGEDLKVGRLIQIRLQRTDALSQASAYESSISLSLQLPEARGTAPAPGEAEPPCLVTLSTRSDNCRIAFARETLDNREAMTTMDILSLNLIRDANGTLLDQTRPFPDVPPDSITEGALGAVGMELQ